MRLVCPGGCGLRPGALSGRDRRLRRLQHGHLPADQRARRAPRCRPVRQRLPGGVVRHPAGRPFRYPGDPHLLQAEPARAVDDGPERLLDLPARHLPSLPKPASLPVRHGAGRRGVDHLPPEARLHAPGRRHGLARRHLPSLRRRRQRHDLRRRRGDGAAEAPGRRDRRWRSCLCRHSRQRGQQRRWRQGRLHRPQHPRTGGGHRLGPGRCRRRRQFGGLRRMPWHRHAAGRPDRVRGSGRGVRAAPRRRHHLRPGLGQGEHRPPRRRFRRRRPDQGGAGAASRRDSAPGEFSQTQPAHRSRGEPLLHPDGADSLAQDGHPASGRRELVRRGRHERARRARGGPGDRAPGRRRPPPAGAAAVRPQRRGTSGLGRRACGDSRSEHGVPARRRRLHPADGPSRVRAPGRRRRRVARRSHRGAACTAGTGRPTGRRSAAGVHVSRAGRAVSGNGAFALRRTRLLPGGGRRRRGHRRSHRRPRPARHAAGAVGRQRQRHATRPARAVHLRICAGKALDLLGPATCRHGRPQRR